MSILKKSSVGLKHSLHITWKGFVFEVLVKSVTVEDVPPKKQEHSFEPGYKNTTKTICEKPNWLFEDAIHKEFQIRTGVIKVTLNVYNDGPLTVWAADKYPPRGFGYILSPDNEGWMASFTGLQVMGGINNVIMMSFEEMKLIDTNHYVNPK